MCKTPRNMVVVLTTKDKTLKASSMNTALDRLQRRHPLLHSVLMSLPFVGPYFAISGAPLLVRELAARETMDHTAERTFELQVQGVVDNELNAQFATPYSDFLDRLAVARTRQILDEANERAGTIEPGTGVTEQQVASQIPQLPLLRVTLVNGAAGLGQALVVTLPQIIADGPSSVSLVKELLEQVAEVESYEAKGETPAADPPYLLCMHSMDEFFPRKVGGIGAAFSNFGALFARWRSVLRKKVSDLEKFQAWIPIESRSVRALSGSVSKDSIEKLKQRAKEHNVTLGHTLNAAAAAATHEIFFADRDAASLPLQVWVNLRPHFDAPIADKHLGLLAGFTHGQIESAVGDSIWDLATRAKTLDAQIPNEAFRSTRWALKWVEFDSNVFASSNEKPVVAPVVLSPVTTANMGKISIPDNIIQRFKLDSASTYFGQAENTRFTTFSSLPNGDLKVTVTFPDLIFKRSDMQEYVDAICQHLQSTAEGL